MRTTRTAPEPEMPSGRGREPGSYPRNQLDSKQFAADPKLAVKFYIEAGIFEADHGGTGGDILEASRQLRDVLLA